MNSPQVIIFDVDGTLVKPWTAELLPGRASRLKQLHEADKQIYLATNQGGPAYHLAFRLSSSNRADLYPDLLRTLNTLEDIRAKIGAKRCYVALHPGNLNVLRTLQEHTEIDENERTYYNRKVVYCWSAQWRKPCGQMLQAIMDEDHMSKNQYLFIGNDATDLKASQKANISYLDAHQFFNHN